MIVDPLFFDDYDAWYRVVLARRGAVHFCDGYFTAVLKRRRRLFKMGVFGKLPGHGFLSPCGKNGMLFYERGELPPHLVESGHRVCA